MLLNNMMPESPAEEMALTGFKRFGLDPIRNYQVEYFYIDFAFPEKMVGIEINSVKWHTNSEKDLRRWKFLESRGWKMYKFMAKQVIRSKWLPAGYVYLKEFANDPELIRVARLEVYKFVKDIVPDYQRAQLMKGII